MRTREEHIQWSVARAIAYLDAGDLRNCLASMASDMGKHPECDDAVTWFMLGVIGTRAAGLGDAAALRRVIEGFDA